MREEIPGHFSLHCITVIGQQQNTASYGIILKCLEILWLSLEQVWPNLY